MRHCITLLLLLVCVPLLSNAQYNFDKNIDSLSIVLSHHSKEDTVRVDILNALSRQHGLKQDSDSGRYYGQMALKLAQQLNFKKGIAVAYRYIGNSYVNQSDSALAILNYQKALAISTQIGEEQGQVDNLRNMALTYQNGARYDNSLASSEKALKIARQMNNPGLIAALYNDIGEMFITATNYPQALEYYQKAVTVSEKANDKLSLAATLSKIGWLYKNQRDSAKAVDYLARALKINKQINNQREIASCLTSLANIYMICSDLDRSFAYYSEAIVISKRMNDLEMLAGEYSNVVNIFLVKSDFSTAKKYLDSIGSILERQPMPYNRLLYLQAKAKMLLDAPPNFIKLLKVNPGDQFNLVIAYSKQAFKIAKEMNIPEQKLQALGYLIIARESQGNYKEAYLKLQELMGLADSIRGDETNKQIVQKEVQYSFDKKADAVKVIQEKKDIKQRTVRNSLLAGLSFLAIFLVVVFRQNKLVKKEKKRSEDLLLNILPSSVAEELKVNGKAEAHRFDNISVLFTDFVNFTGTSEKLTPEQLVTELHECFTAFDYIMEKNGLEKIKTIGDAYMAVCGIPDGREDHARRTVQAAIDIMNFMKTRGQQQHVFGIRIGINSGAVVAGIVGVKKFAYDIWGDAVNTAARMEQNSEPGRINISEITYELVKNAFDCSFRGELEAKNKGKLKMYFVEGEAVKTEPIQA